MRLRNKKTGEVVELFERGPIDLYFYPNNKDLIDRKTYQSLAELNADWEDYTPKEPLIKDEKIRKAIRAWAEANRWTGEVKVQFIDFSYHKSWGLEQLKDNNEIHFSERMPDLNHLAEYTIDELCGDE